VARALPGSAQQQRHFIAGEVVAQALFAGHANNSPQTPSPSSPTSRESVQRVPSARTAPRSVFSGGKEVGGAATRNITPKALPVFRAEAPGHHRDSRRRAGARIERHVRHSWLQLDATARIVKTENTPQCRAFGLAPSISSLQTLEVAHRQCNTEVACP
jgi:hypothetical protein